MQAGRQVWTQLLSMHVVYFLMKKIIFWLLQVDACLDFWQVLVLPCPI